MADETLKWRGHEIPRVEPGYYQLSTPGFFIVAWAAVEGMSHAQLAVEGVPHMSAYTKGTLVDALEVAASALNEKLQAIDDGRAALLKQPEKAADLESLKTRFATADRDNLLTRIAELEAQLVERDRVLAEVMANDACGTSELRHVPDIARSMRSDSKKYMGIIQRVADALGGTGGYEPELLPAEVAGLKTERDRSRADVEDLLARSCATSQALGKDWTAGDELHAAAVSRIRAERDSLRSQITERTEHAKAKTAGAAPGVDVARALELLDAIRTAWKPTYAGDVGRLAELEYLLRSAAAQGEPFDPERGCPICKDWAHFCDDCIAAGRERAYLDGYTDGRQEAESEVSESVQGEPIALRADRWIPCSERMPQKSYFVLVCAEGYMVRVACYSATDGCWLFPNADGTNAASGEHRVTHWMRAPGLPGAEPPAEQPEQLSGEGPSSRWPQRLARETLGPRGDDDDIACRGCASFYECRNGCDDTGLCDSCAQRIAADDVPKLIARIAELEAQLVERDRIEKMNEGDITELIDRRDELEKRLDEFVEIAGGEDVCGEHSNLNDPWKEAAEQLCIVADAMTEIMPLVGTKQPVEVAGLVLKLQAQLTERTEHAKAKTAGAAPGVDVARALELLRTIYKNASRHVHGFHGGHATEAIKALGGTP